MNTANKRIAINTAIIYIRMIAVTLIGLCTTRYVLQALGISDYGLFNVVGGMLTMLNVVSIAMHTTTQRYINVEMGSPKGNMNKIFNICFTLHIGFALFILLLSETIGVYYINNYLNVQPDRLNDAFFVFHISVLVSVLGIINVPYQGLLCAYEKFGQIALIDFSTTLLKIPLVVLLMIYSGNSLRFYAIGTCLISFISFILYQWVANKQYAPIVKKKIVWDKKLYKEILTFNNYTAIGAFAYLGRNQGATMLINYFFGTLVNGSFAIAYQIENFIVQFVNNLNSASTPQVIQNYSRGDINQAFKLASNITRYSILIMLLILLPIALNFKFLLEVWLGVIPKGTLELCYWILLSLFIRSLATALPPIIQASGKVKWFQVISSTLLIIGLPLSYILFTFGYNPQTIIIVFSILDFASQIASLWLLNRIIKFDVIHFSIKTYVPIVKLLIVLAGLAFVRFQFSFDNVLLHLLSIIVSVFCSIISLYLLGLNQRERYLIKNKIHILIFSHLKRNQL